MLRAVEELSVNFLIVADNNNGILLSESILDILLCIALIIIFFGIPLLVLCAILIHNGYCGIFVGNISGILHQLLFCCGTVCSVSCGFLLQYILFSDVAGLLDFLSKDSLACLILTLSHSDNLAVNFFPGLISIAVRLYNLIGKVAFLILFALQTASLFIFQIILCISLFIRYCLCSSFLLLLHNKNSLFLILAVYSLIFLMIVVIFRYFLINPVSLFIQHIISLCILL